MGFYKLIIVSVAVWIAFRLYKHLTNRPSVSKNQTGINSSKKMVQCKTCGLHVPIDEALPKMMITIAAVLTEIRKIRDREYVK